MHPADVGGPGRRDVGQRLAADPLFCDLLACLPTHLEHDMKPEQVVEFKHACYTPITAITDAIERALPTLGRQGSADALAAATALAGDRLPTHADSVTDCDLRWADYGFGMRHVKPTVESARPTRPMRRPRR